MESSKTCFHMIFEAKHSRKSCITNIVLQHNRFRVLFFYSGRFWSGKNYLQVAFFLPLAMKIFCYLNSFWIWCFCQTLFWVFKLKKNLIGDGIFCFHLQIAFFLLYQLLRSRTRPLILVTLVALAYGGMGSFWS